MKSTHILIFKGIGIWKDQEGQIYRQNDRVEIESDKDEKGFLNSRPDIKFMVGYGQLEINTATIETEAKVETDVKVATPVADVKVATPVAKTTVATPVAK